MLKVDRQNLIEHELKLKGSITISECVELLEVSEETVRRDFREMEEAERLTRIYGGAYIQESDDKNVPLPLREVLFLKEKDKMAEYVVRRLIKENESIMIDASSTCFQLAKMILASGINVTIITNSLKIMELFEKQQPNTRLIGIGGKYRSKSCSFVGDIAAKQLESFLVDKCFISISALDPKFGLIDSSLQECQIHKVMLAQSKFHYILADHTKFSARADYIVAPFKNINSIITDSKNDPLWDSIFEDLNIDFIY